MCPTRCTYHLCKSNEGFFDQVVPFQCLQMPFQICQPWLLIMHCQEYTFGVICSSALQYGINSDIVLYFQIVLLTSIHTLLPSFFNTGNGTFPWDDPEFSFQRHEGVKRFAICHNFDRDRAIFQGTWKVTGRKKVTNSCRKSIPPKNAFSTTAPTPVVHHIHHRR